jgi:hypothetical protein
MRELKLSTAVEDAGVAMSGRIAVLAPRGAAK